MMMRRRTKSEWQRNLILIGGDIVANKIAGLTIEIGGETTGLNKALSSVNKQSKGLQSELRQVDRLLKLDPKNTELIAQKQKILAESISNTKSKLETLKEAEKQAQEQFKKGEISEEQYRALQREIIGTENKLEGYEKQLKEVNEESNVFSQKLDEASKKLKTVGEKTEKVGEGLSKNVTAPIAAIGAASMVAFNEVDGALDTIVTKTGATGKAMDGFEDSFRNVAKKMPAELQSVGDAIGEVNTQFGLTGEALEKASEQVIKFSEINGQDVTASTIASKNAIEAFGLSANDLDMVLDSVTKTAQNTGVGTDKLFDSVVKGAPQLKALGLDFAQATEIMGSFEQKGIDSSKALSYMSKAQVTFAKEGKTLEEGLAELTEKLKNSTSETDKLTLVSEYFGTKGATFMLDAINRGALDFENFAGAAENAAGAVTETFEGTLDPIDNFKTAMNNLKLVGADIATSLQETLGPMLEKLVEKLQEFSDWWKELSPQMQEMIIKIALVAAAIGPLLITIGKLTTGISSVIDIGKKLKTGFNAISGLMTPHAPLLIGIAAVVAAGVLLYKNWDTIKEKAGQLKEAISEKFEAIKTGITDKINAAKDAVKNAIEKIKGFFDFKWELPKIKLPHFNIQGKFSMNPPQIPKFAVDWYKTGAIFNSPNVIGVGEAGPEAVLPIEKIDSIIASAIQKARVGNSDIIVQNMYVRDDNDIKKIAREFYILQQKNSRGKGIVAL